MFLPALVKLLLLCARKGLLDTYAGYRALGTTVPRKWLGINSLRGVVWVLVWVSPNLAISRDRASSKLPARAGLRRNRIPQKALTRRKIQSFDRPPQKPKAAEPNACSGTWDRPLSGSRRSGPRTGVRIWCKRIQKSACGILRKLSSRIYEVWELLTNGLAPLWRTLCRIKW
jgi:hypothetical protein